MKETLRNLLLVFSGVLLFFSLVYTLTRPATPREYHVTAYLRNVFDDNGHNPLKQGMEQAAIDLQVEIAFASFEEELTMQEKQLRLRQDIENGSAGIVLEPENETVFNDVVGDIPLVLLNHSVEGPLDIPVITADNHQMGQRLAEEIQQENDANQPILVVKPPNLYAQEAANQQGLIDYFNAEKIPYDQLALADQDVEGTLMAQAVRNNYFAIVCLGSELSETIGKLKKNQPQLAAMNLYGFGFSNHLLNLVDQGVIQGLSVSNQFAVGYAAVSQLMAQVNGEETRIPSITSLIVTKESLFDPDNQKLLFPLIQ